MPGGIAPANAVAFGLTLAWALVGFVDTRARDRTGAQGVSLPSAGRRSTPWWRWSRWRPAARPRLLHASSGARDVATLAALVVTAISFHFLLALPDGRLHDSVRRVLAVGGYVVALGRRARVRPATTGPSRVADGAISWAIAGVLAIAPMRSRYIGSIGLPPGADGVVRHRGDAGGHGRARGDGAPPAGGLAGAARRRRGGSDRARPARVCWPARAGGWGRTPAGAWSRCSPSSGSSSWCRRSTWWSSSGSGHAPKTTGDKEVLALSMVASGVAALIFVPVRARFLDSATRFVYGSREAPDEVLRTFGSRLTRAIPMDELLLQLAESLRKTMGLDQRRGVHGDG